jgi:hypothetical protein
MSIGIRGLVVVAVLAASSAPAVGQARPEAELAALVKAYFALGDPPEWQALERLPGFKWAPLPPSELTHCLPSGDCFARQGSTTLGGRQVMAGASGARTMVVSLLLRNMGQPLGGGAVAAALEGAGLGGKLARCPIKPEAPGTSWYRLEGDGKPLGFLAVQPPAAGRPNEGFVISRGAELPALAPNLLALYTEQCAPGAARAPVATGKPHELLAAVVVKLLVPGARPGFYDWKALGELATGITWLGDGPKKMDLTSQGDPNPIARTGSLELAGRKFSVLASGTAGEVRAVRLEEGGLHPRGEHMLGVVYEKGIAVRLTRCGPVYTESTNNWYALSSSGTRPAQIRQSIRYDGNQVQDSYEIRLDGTLPPRDSRDRDPGVNGCR